MGLLLQNPWEHGELPQNLRAGAPALVVVIGRQIMLVEDQLTATDKSWRASELHRVVISFVSGMSGADCLSQEDILGSNMS
jgi:hypothetical protein